MHRALLRQLAVGALGALLSLVPIHQSSVLATLPDRSHHGAPAGPQTDAPAEVSLAGLWDFGKGLVVEIKQDGSSITSTVVRHECSGGSWDELVSGDLQGESLTGTMHRCTSDTNVVVSECGMPQLWDANFTAKVSRSEIVGTYRGQHITWDTVGGKATNCKLDYEYDEQFTGTRLDCRPLTFEQLATEHPSAASEVDLATEFENGKTLDWNDTQIANGFKSRAESFLSGMLSMGYPGSINSAYRPLLYQAHFANLRECGLTLIQALVDHPDLADEIGKSVDALKAEVDTKHGLQTEITTVAGLSVPVAYVCWREPLEYCPHVDGKAIDARLREDATLDWAGALQGWCRRYLPQDKPHWEEISQGRCGQQFGPGHADIKLTVESPVAVMVTDPSGRRFGKDSATGTTVNDFGAGAYYTASSEPQQLFIPAAVVSGDEIVIALTATGDGPYKVRLGFLADNALESPEILLEGVAKLGQPIERVHQIFRPTSEQPVLYPDANPISPEIGWAQSFEVDGGAGAHVVSVNPASAASLLVNSKLGAVGVRLPPGTLGEVSVRVPSAIVDAPVRVLVDGRDVPSSVEVANGLATVHFAVPAGARVVDIRGKDASGSAAGGGWPILPIVLAGLLAAALVVAVFFARRRRKGEPAKA